MGMPKGYRVESGYSTVGKGVGGMDYRRISQIMTRLGYKMNHATARNEFLRAMKKLVVAFADQNNLILSEKEISRIARDPQFQSGACEIIQNMQAE